MTLFWQKICKNPTLLPSEFKTLLYLKQLKPYLGNCTCSWLLSLLQSNQQCRYVCVCVCFRKLLTIAYNIHIWAYIYCYQLFRWALIGFIAISIFMLTSFITTGVLTYVNHFPPSIPGIIQDVTLRCVSVFLSCWLHFQTIVICDGMDTTFISILQFGISLYSVYFCKTAFFIYYYYY